MPKWILYSVILLSLGGYYIIGYHTERSDFRQLISLYSALFLCSYIILKNKSQINLNLLIYTSLIFRFCLLFSIPALSDDFYRFLWDGRIQQLQFNPFDYTPRQLLVQSSDTFLVELFPKLNSPDYYSVYPQLCQSIFNLAAWIGQDSLLNNIIVLKSFILLAETGSIFLLLKLLQAYNIDQKQALIYALNPLVIVELSGNIHFEAFMISFFLLAVWLMMNRKVYLSAAALSLAIQAKLLPLIALPLLFSKTGVRKALYYSAICLLMTVVMSLGTINSFERISNIMQSLNLYYGKFEFNGGLYNLFRTIGWHILGYNPIQIVTKILFLMSLTGMIWVYFKSTDLLSGFFLLLSIYLGFSAIVHPWYLCPLIALTPFVNYRFVLIWSALIPLSYFTYSKFPYSENSYLVALEYLSVAYFLIREYSAFRSEPIQHKNPEGLRNS